MFIQTEETPNPATIKFIPDGNVVLPNSTAEFKNQKQASAQSPLAMQLFAIDGIEAVFFGHDFITVTKSGNASWQYLTPEIQAIIMDFFVSKKPIMFEGRDVEVSKNTVNSDDSEIVKQIKELIEIKVRPAVAMDGGDIIFHSFEDGIVYLVLKGSCSGCPSSTVTLKSGIENMLKHYIPEVEAVEQVSDE
ncbi:MAG: NifU family protein [Alphaproteobacteria bacterium]|nr:NifU family protein [Alphaproteobacteria bacterium]